MQFSPPHFFRASSNSLLWSPLLAGLLLTSNFALAAALTLDDFSVSQEAGLVSAPANTDPNGYWPMTDSQLWDSSLLYGGRHIRAFANPGDLPSPAYSISAGVTGGVFAISFDSVSGGAAGVTYPTFGASPPIDLTGGGAYDRFIVRIRMTGIAVAGVSMRIFSKGSSIGLSEGYVSPDPETLSRFGQSGAYPLALTNSVSFVDIVFPFIDSSQWALWGLSDPYMSAESLGLDVRTFLPAIAGSYNTGSIEISDFFVAGATPVSEPETYTMFLSGVMLVGLASRRRRLKEKLI